MKMLNYYLYTIVLTNIIFLLMNARYLVFLRQKTVSPAEATHICVDKQKKRLVIQGKFIGMLGRKGKYLVSDRLCTLNNSVILNVNRKTISVLNEYNGLTYGEEVNVYGTIEYIGNDFVLHNISIISVTQKAIIKKYLNKRYTVAAIIAIVIVILKEVLNYAFL